MKSYFSNPGFFLIVIFLLGMGFYINGQEITDSSNTLSILFIGDIMGHDEQIRSAENRIDHTYDYEDVFKEKSHKHHQIMNGEL